MPIDSSIYAQIQSPDIFGSVAKGLQLKDMLGKQRKEQDAQAESDAIKKAMSSSVIKNQDGTMSLDRKNALSQIAGAGYAQKAFDMQKQFEAEDLASKQNKLQQTKADLELQGQFLGSAVDQTSWEQSLARANQAGIDTSKLPPVYDKGFVRRLLYQNMSSKDRVEQQLKQQQFGLDQKKFGLDEKKTTAEIAKLQAEAAKTKAEASGKSGMTEGQKALDKDYAKDYNDWTSTGKAALDKNLARLQDAKAMLQQDPSLTGSIRGMLPDAIRNTTNETAIRVRDQVRAAAQGALKATLGSAFTEKEGERIMNQAYNERLSPEENIRKIDLSIQELEANRDNNEAKAKLFGETGSISKLAKMGSKTNAEKKDSPQLVRMRDPKGNIRNIPADQVGEAIAAGGTKL